MISFESDYIEGAHPKILEKLAETNFIQAPGYGKDPWCLSAEEKIRIACSCPDAEVRFLAGGTQTNETVISAWLRSYECVVAVSTGHISLHEAGAIEHTGHEVMMIPQHDGKMDADELKTALDNFYADENRDQMTFPGMVYISHPTEYGTLYSADELRALSAVCRNYHLPLFLDGARLGYGLMSSGTDVTLPLLAECCDVFYIGGTKVGALCGEAIVFPHGAPAHFVTTMKQHGALLAKGRLIGIQFDVLFTDNLYWDISRHAIELAERLRDIFLNAGYSLLLNSPTNQQFVILDRESAEELKKEFAFSFWERYDDTRTVYRFATSWATRAESLDALERALAKLSENK